MLEILKQKLLAWTPDAANAIYGNTLRVADELFTNATWEMSPTGIFLISPDVSAYYDLNGETHYLSLGDQTANLALKAQLSEYAEQNDLTRIERPVQVELIDIYGIPYTYSKEVSPYGVQGVPIENMVLVPQAELVNTIKELFKNWMIGCNDLLTCIQNVPGATYTQGIAKDVFRYDPVTEKFFFLGPLFFGKTQEEFTADARANNQANMLDNFLQQRYKITDSIQDEIYNFVKTECSTLQSLT